MKTYNYCIDLMVPMQINKEILFNEAQVTLDSFCNCSIIDFIDSAPNKPIIGEKYIISQSKAEQSNDICYCNSLMNGWQFLKAKTHMILFVQKQNNFFIFQNNEWSKIYHDNIVPNLKQNDNFTIIENIFVVPNDVEYLYLHLANNVIMDFRQIHNRKFTMILKQNPQEHHIITWPKNIIWPNNAPHQIASKANSFDIIDFYLLSNGEHIIAKVII